MDLEKLKDEAGRRALEEVSSGMRLGLGTGSTVAWFLQHLAAALTEGRLAAVAGVPTSLDTEHRCRDLGIPLLNLSDEHILDLAVDGTDEVTPELDLIKGHGGALLREKMVACAARRFVIIADETKKVPRLGRRIALPVEVIPFEWRWHVPFLEGYGARVSLKLDPEGMPVVSDNGNHLLHCEFPEGIEDPWELQRALNDRPGIVEHGLFLGLCDMAILAGSDGIEESCRRRTS